MGYVGEFDVARREVRVEEDDWVDSRRVDVESRGKATGENPMLLTGDEGANGGTGEIRFRPKGVRDPRLG